jgi:hypothetical protein
MTDLDQVARPTATVAPSRSANARSTWPSRHPDPAGWDIVEVWGEDSFPASDPPANW